MTTINEINIILIILSAVIVVLLIVVVIQSLTLNKLKKRVDRFMGTRKEKYSLETMLVDYSSRVQHLGEKYDKIVGDIDVIKAQLENCMQKVGFVRYNPFNEMGGDLCFALALLDENNNGFIINTIHGREASYTYAKTVTAAESQYNLSDEEKEAIRIAMTKSL